MSTVNSYILDLSYSDNPVIRRTEFLRALAQDFIPNQMRNRIGNPRINHKLRTTMKLILGNEEEIEDKTASCIETKLNPRKTCCLYSPKKKGKTAYLCLSCKSTVCLDDARIC